MKKLIIACAGLATLAYALPAAAQVRIEDRDAPGVVVRHYHDWGWRRSHAEFRGDCRVVKVRTRLPNGDVIVKTRRSCD